MVKFVLKVGKQTLEVNHELEQNFEDFQAKVFALTDIPPKNLKVLAKSKMIKDIKTLMELPQGTQLVIMGTKSTQQLKATGTIKIETMAIEKPKIPNRFGLVNIGNTCYMNASIQLLRNIPQFNKLITNTKINNPTNSEQRITVALAHMFKELDFKDIEPKLFVMLFLQHNQQFMPFGTQQDSDEFMQKLLSNVSQASPQIAYKIGQLFKIQFIQTLKNKQLQQGEQINITESMKLCCSIGGMDKDYKVGTLLEGIKLSLNTQLQKISPIDNNNHHYSKTIRFNKLPKYLMVQMVRFFWKEAGEDHGSKSIAAKICKSIDFGFTLDLFDYCSPNLQEQLLKGRQAIQANKKKQQQQYKKAYEQYKNSLGDINRPQTRIIQQFKQKYQKPKLLEQGLQTGIYQMISVVTHHGNSVQSGHYLAWVKQTQDQWMKYDDNTVYPQPQSKVLQLRGGQPNLQIAYITLFRKVYTKPI